MQVCWFNLLFGCKLLLDLGGPSGQDFSAQWAEYYRSIGKMKEAEAIEAQMRAKAGGQPGYPGGAPAAAPYPGQPGFQAQPQGYYPPQQVRALCKDMFKYPCEKFLTI